MLLSEANLFWKQSLQKEDKIHHANASFASVCGDQSMQVPHKLTRKPNSNVNVSALMKGGCTVLDEAAYLASVSVLFRAS